MKKLVFASAVLLATFGASASDTHEENWEAGVALGRDYGEKRDIAAISVGAPLGAGFKAVLEFAKGRSGDVTESEGGETVTKHERGSDVYTLKVAKELFSVGHLEFGAALGMAHLSAASKSGEGVVAGVEAAYPLTHHVEAKVEVTRFFGNGSLSSTKANVVQAGLVYKF